MRSILVLLGLGLLFGYVCGAPAALSCAGVNPQLVHDGRGFQIHAPMIDGATTVDAHIEMDGIHDVLNVRLIPSSSDPNTYELPQAIEVHETSAISFHLTYMSNRGYSACDTQQYQTATAPRRTAAPAPEPAPASQAQAEPAPAPADETETAACSLPAIQHQVMRNDAGLYIIEVMSPEPYSYIDLHSTIGSAAETKIRIAHDVATAQSSPISIPAGEELRYWLTYAIGDVTCNTGMYTTGPLT